MKSILFVDDEPHNIETVVKILKESITADIHVVTSVEDAIQILNDHPIDVVVTDIFIPLGNNARKSIGPRARQYEENLRHLGGLALLDAIDKLARPPKVLAHTACTDFALLEVLGEHVVERIPKPTAIDIVLKTILDCLDDSDPWQL